MNKTMLILVVGLLLIPFSAIAEMHGNVEIGKDLNNDEAYAMINLEYDFDILIFRNVIYSSVENWFRIQGVPTLMLYDVFRIGYKIEYGIFSIDISHWCAHSFDEGVPYLLSKSVYVDSERTIISAGIKW